jgi:hypothetical protein
MLWKTFFHGMENFPESFPHYGKNPAVPAGPVTGRRRGLRG